MKHFLRTPYWQLKLPTAINGLSTDKNSAFFNKLWEGKGCHMSGEKVFLY